MTEQTFERPASVGIFARFIDKFPLIYKYLWSHPLFVHIGSTGREPAVGAG
jgi:hypothetical protein